MTNNLGSFRAGFHSHLILNPKWRLHIGLGYALRNINQETTITADQESSFPIPEEMDVFDPNNTITINPTINETEPAIAYKFTKFQYVELPILFQYQFSPKWTVDLGGQIAYTSRYHFQQIGNANSTASFNTANFLALEDATFVDNLSLTAIGGISFQIAPKISAYSSYHFANYYLKNVAASIEEQRKWQKIEVGIRYYFK